MLREEGLYGGGGLGDRHCLRCRGGIVHCDAVGGVVEDGMSLLV